MPRAGEAEPGWLERYEARATELASLEQWTLEGRLAVSDANDGGSGKLRWQEAADGRRMDFHGALGRGAWRLVSGSAGAELELADGSSFRAASVAELVRGQLGWNIPVEALSWWVLGLEAPGQPETRYLNDDGTLSSLGQQGWKIEYDRYRQVDGFTLPSKLTARQGEKTVKLAIRQWELDAGHE